MSYIERISPCKDECDNQDIYKEHIIRYKFCLPFIKNKKILDMACGTGYGSNMIAINQAEQVWGGDISADAINRAKLKYQAQNLRFGLMDAVSLPFNDNFFDIVVSFETIEHLAQPELFIKEVRRVLKPDGLLIISTPNKSASAALGINNPHHLIEFNREELAGLLKKYFADIDLYGQRRLRTLSFSQRALRRLYFIYSQISFLSFISKFVPAYTKYRISHHIEGLSLNCEIEPNRPDYKYLYLVALAKNRCL